MIYIVYGVAESALALFVTKLVPNGTVSSAPFSLARSYAAALKDPRIRAIVATVLGVGFAVFGTFSYSGHYVSTRTKMPILMVGLVVTAFGVGAIASSRLLPQDTSQGALTDKAFFLFDNPPLIL